VVSIFSGRWMINLTINIGAFKMLRLSLAADKLLCGCIITHILVRMAFI